MIGEDHALSMTRRSILALGAAIPAGLCMAAPALAGSALRHDIRYVVTDRRFLQSVLFGAALEAKGARRLDVTDGLTRAWRDTLAPLWRSRPGAVAGLTAASVRDCLVEQARGCGHRLVLSGHHQLEHDGGFAVHSFSAIEPIHHTLARASDTWPMQLAHLVAGYAADRPAPVARGDVVRSGTAITLTSWMIV